MKKKETVSIETLSFELIMLVNCVELTSENESYPIVFDAGVYELTDLTLMIKVIIYSKSNAAYFSSLKHIRDTHCTCCFCSVV